MLPIGNAKSPTKKESKSQNEGWFPQAFRRLFSSNNNGTKSCPGGPDRKARVRLLRRHSESPEAFQLFLRKRALEVKQDADGKRQEDLRPSIAVEGSWILDLMRTSDLAECLFVPSIEVKDLNSIQLDPCGSWDQVQKLQQYPSGQTTGPKRFARRSLHIGFCCTGCGYGGSDSDEHRRWLSDRLPIFIAAIKEILERVGDQILHFSLLLRCSHFGVPVSLEQIYAILGEWLSLVPNLKWLQINADRVKDPNLKKTPIISLPTLEHLERFDFHGGIKDLQIWDAILAANPQVKIINVMPSHPTSKEFNLNHLKEEVDAYMDPSVLNLQLEAARFGRRWNNNWDFSTLSKHIQDKNNWKLKRLSLWMLHGNFPNSLDVVFAFVQSFQTLEHVEIHMKPKPGGQIKVGSTFLLLPNLKHFRLEFSKYIKSKSLADQDFFYSLMFLLECGKLETLVWEHELFADTSHPQDLWHQLERRKEKMLIGFMDGFEDLRESNIWNVFPMLRTIKLRNNLPWKKRVGFDWDFKVYQDRHLVEECRVDSKCVKSTTECHFWD